MGCARLRVRPPVLIKIRTTCLSEPWSRKINGKRSFQRVPGTRRLALFAPPSPQSPLAILVPRPARTLPLHTSLIIVQVFSKERITRSMFTASSKLFISSVLLSQPPSSASYHAPRLHGPLSSSSITRVHLYPLPLKYTTNEETKRRKKTKFLSTKTIERNDDLATITILLLLLLLLSSFSSRLVYSRVFSPFLRTLLPGC